MISVLARSRCGPWQLSTEYLRVPYGGSKMGTKLRVLPTGEIEIELNGGGVTEDVLDLLNKLQNDARKKTAGVPNPKLSEAPALSGKQYEVWEYLCENDAEVGVTGRAIADHLNTTIGAIGARLKDMIEMGYAVRIGSARSGRYRAATP